MGELIHPQPRQFQAVPRLKLVDRSKTGAGRRTLSREGEDEPERSSGVRSTRIQTLRTLIGVAVCQIRLPAVTDERGSMRKTVSVGFLMMLFSASTFADNELPQDAISPTVRGVALGATEAELIQQLKINQRSMCSGRPTERRCSLIQGTIGAVRTNDFYTFDEADRLREVTMYFPTEGYAVVRDAFGSKYGQPSKAATANFKNQFGASFDFETALWIGKTMVVQLMQYESFMSAMVHRMDGVAIFTTRARYEDELAKAEEARKKAAKDF
jgi:hypothetical protein